MMFSQFLTWHEKMYHTTVKPPVNYFFDRRTYFEAVLENRSEDEYKDCYKQHIEDVKVLSYSYILSTHITTIIYSIRHL